MDTNIKYTHEVTVLMAVYNGEKYLKRCLNSILDQTLTDFEFIIINDKSTDNSRNIILSFNDPRIILIDNDENIGLTRSLNIGLKLAKGKYIARIDADDISELQRLEKQQKFLTQHKDHVACGTWYKTLSNNNIVKLPVSHNDILQCMVLFNPIAHPSVMLNNEILKKNNIEYDDFFIYAQDYELWYNIKDLGKLANIPEPLLTYNNSDDQISTKFLDKQTYYASIVKRKILKDSFHEYNTNNLSAIIYNNNIHITDITTCLDESIKLFNKIESKITNKEEFYKYKERFLKKCMLQYDFKSFDEVVKLLRLFIINKKNNYLFVNLKIILNNILKHKLLYKLARNFPIQSNYKENNTILISGTGRSGTTLLEEIINFNNNYRVIFEPFHNKYVPECKDMGYRPFFEIKDTSRLQSIKNILTGKLKNKWTDKYNKKLISNKRVIKDIRTNILLPYIHNHFKQIKIIVLLRHPCAVANSKIKLGWDSPIEEYINNKAFFNKYLYKYSDIIEQYSSDIFDRHVLLWCIENYIPVKELYNKKNIQFILYENLILDFKNQIDIINNFLNTNIPTSKHLLNIKSQTSRTESINDKPEELVLNWKKSITEEQLKRTNYILKKFDMSFLYNNDGLPR